MTKKNPQLGWGFFILSKNLCSYKHCRGEHCSSAENRRFSDYPQRNNGIFALRRQIFLQKNLRTTDGRPYNCFFTSSKDVLPKQHVLFSYFPQFPLQFAQPPPLGQPMHFLPDFLER